MKKLPYLVATLVASAVFVAAHAEERFGRPVVKVENAGDYQFSKTDEVSYPSLSNDKFLVSCLVYRGTQHYYVEVTVLNKTTDPVNIPTTFISFDKLGYSVYRIDTMQAANEAAAFAGVRFSPRPTPYVAPTYHTTIDTNTSTYGSQSSTSGTATTTADYSGQAGANFGNAIGNAIAARRFYKAQRTDVAFSQFLASHVQTDADSPLLPGQSRSIVATFDQPKQKRKPFHVQLRLAADTFNFAYKE